MPAAEPSTLVTATSRPSSFQYPRAWGSDEWAECPTEMSLVVTAKTTFLRGLSCAWLAASHRPSTMPRMATAVTMRFIECPLFRGRRPGWCSRADGLVGLRPEDHVPLHRLHDKVEDHPHHGEQDEHGEDAGDVEGEVELQDQVAEPFL